MKILVHSGSLHAIILQTCYVCYTTACLSCSTLMLSLHSALLLAIFQTAFFHFFGYCFPLESFCSSDELLDVVDFFFVKVLLEMLFYDLFDLLWLWHTSFLIVMYKLDILMFMCRAFAALNIQVSSLVFSTSPTRSSALFFSGISNFLIHLFQYILPWFSQLFSLVWFFAIFSLEYYVFLFF